MNKLVLLVEDILPDGTLVTPFDILCDFYKKSGRYIESWMPQEKHHFVNLCKNYIEFKRVRDITTLDPNTKYLYYVPTNLFFELPPLNLFQIISQETFNFLHDNNITFLITYQFDMFDPCVVNHFINKFFDWQRYHMWNGIHTNKTIFYTGCKLHDGFTNFLHESLPEYKFLYSPLLFYWARETLLKHNYDPKSIYETYISYDNKKLYTHLNKSGRIHRYTLLHGLRAHGLLEDSITSNVHNLPVDINHFRELVPVECYNSFQAGQRNTYQEKLFADMSTGEIPKILLDVDMNSTHSYVNWNYEPVWFYNSCFEIVGETGSYYDKTNWLQFSILSEKIVKTMYNFKPFMINGGPNCLQILKNMGFETFPELFDESYDTELNMIERQRKIVENVLRWKDNKLEFMNQVRKIKWKLEHNHNHLLNLDVEKLIYDDLYTKA